MEGEFQCNTTHSLSLPDLTATSFFSSASATSIHSSSAAPRSDGFPCLDTINQPTPPHCGSPRLKDSSSSMDIVPHDAKITTNPDYGVFNELVPFSMFGNHSPKDAIACSLPSPSTFSTTPSGNTPMMLDSLMAKSKDEKQRVVITMYCAREQVGSLLQSMMEVINPLVGDADGSVHISM